MKFYSGRGVLEYWYVYGYAVKNYSMPGVFISEEDEVTPPSIKPENCDYPDWWYTWIDIDKLIIQLTKAEHMLIIYYFTRVYDNDKSLTDYNIDDWAQKDLFSDLCDKLYRMMDAEEYKPSREYGYRDFERTLKIIFRRVERGTIDVNLIEDKLYTVAEVADFLRFKQDTIRRILVSGELKGFKVAGEWRIPGTSLISLIGGKNEQTS